MPTLRIYAKKAMLMADADMSINFLSVNISYATAFKWMVKESAEDAADINSYVRHDLQWKVYQS